MSLKRAFRLHLPTLLAQFTALSLLLFLNLRDQMQDPFVPPPPGEPSSVSCDLQGKYGWPVVCYWTHTYYTPYSVDPATTANLYVWPMAMNLATALAILTAAAVLAEWLRRRGEIRASRPDPRRPRHDLGCRPETTSTRRS